MPLRLVSLTLIFFLLSPAARAGGGPTHCQQILKEIEIVVGILMNENSEVLLGKRQPPQDWVGYWEFPGGKVEVGETPEQALVREMKEEVGLDIQIKTLLDERLQNFDSKVLRMRFYLVTTKDPHPQAIAHSEVAWFDRENIRKIPFLVPDHPIFQKIF